MKRAFLNYKRLISKRLELLLLMRKSRAAKVRAEMIEHKKRKKRTQQEIIKLKRELHGAKERTGGSETGALPDFVVIGAKKCGTTFLYDLLTRHPHVEPAAAKELHFFNSHFDEGIEWYRRYFPPPRWKDGRRTITGEATPYLDHLPVPERMAKVVPQARLIALLRNPVDRAYSDYQLMARKKWYRKGWETRTFEEAIEAEKARLLRREDKTPEHEDRAGLGRAPYWYLSRGIYVDQLLRWSRFFGDEQMLVLKSEDFFERTPETLKLVLSFLGLPDWEPGPSEIPKKRNKGRYEQEMYPPTRLRLEEYFEPHNRRLYEYLGVDFGW